MRIVWIVLVLLFSNTILSAQNETTFAVKKMRCLKKKVRQELAGFGVRVKNIRFYGKRRAIGEFWNADSIFQMQHGLLLSTGRATDAGTENTEGGKTTINNNRGHRLFKSVTNDQLYDAAVLQFDFYPNSDYLSFNFVFASEDYPEFIQTGLNDVLAFILTLPNGQTINLAQRPRSDESVSVQTINHEVSPQFYINNCSLNVRTPSLEVDTIIQKTATHQLVLTKQYETTRAVSNQANYPIQYDGFTKVLKAQYPVQPNRRYRLQIAIADRGNRIFDSAVFLEMGSLRSHAEPDYVSGVLRRIPHYYYKIDTLSKTRLKSAISAVTQTINPCATHPPDILFDYDSPNLTIEGLFALKKVALQLEKCEHLGIKINGYAAANKDKVYNNKLSKERAEKVRTYLIKYGVPNYKINVNWHGDGAVKTKAALVKNRRVTLELIIQ